jgi:cell division protein FtsZ
MNITSDSTADPPVSDHQPLAIHFCGIGGAGGRLAATALRAAGEPRPCLVADTDGEALAACGVSGAMLLGRKATRGLGAGGDVERGRRAAEEAGAEFAAAFRGADVVFLFVGLGGGTGGGAAPVVARVAKEAGALVIGFATLPFEFEGTRRERQALEALEELRSVADAVLCLSNEKLAALLDDKATMLAAFQAPNDHLAAGVRGILNLLTRRGLVNVTFADLAAVVRGRHAESAFATVEAEGPNRAADALERLVASPLLAGEPMSAADSVLVSFAGGPDLALAEVRSVMAGLARQCPGADVVMGAALDETFTGRLCLTVIAGRRGVGADDKAGEGAAAAASSQARSDDLGARLEDPRPAAPRRASRFAAPPPEMTPEQKQRLFEQRVSGEARTRRRGGTKMRQGQLPLEIVSRGRFEQSEPTIHQGEDLDVPTYIRRGVALN